MLSMKNYRLAVDENGSPFVLNSKGSIDFGYITEEMNLPAAPIRVAEGLTGPKGYGLKHIAERHEKEIINVGYNSVYDFVEDVANDFTEIKEGKNGSFLLEKGDAYHNTLFVALSREGDYWKVISGEYSGPDIQKIKRYSILPPKCGHLLLLKMIFCQMKI